MCVSYRLICQCVIRVSCYENYTRNTQTALVCTLLPVSYMLRCACWTSVCTKLCRRGQDVEHHRRARCDGSSAPCSGGPQISPHSCAAGAEGPLILAGQNRDFPRGKVAPCGSGAGPGTGSGLISRPYMSAPPGRESLRCVRAQTYSGSRHAGAARAAATPWARRPPPCARATRPSPGSAAGRATRGQSPSRRSG